MTKILDSNKIEGKSDFHTGCRVIFVVDQKSCGTKTMTMGRTILSAGARNRHHSHKCDVTQYVAKGTIKFFLGPEKKEHVLTQGMFLYLTHREPHSFENLSKTDTAEVIFNYSGVTSFEAAETEFLE